ncbi:MAG: YkgJ family cysteine cluster protein [Desulfobacterales bacterium]|nr:MAG: YkgJ family cysteine cluster protein [Desulfobacterales bacterium]
MTTHCYQCSQNGTSCCKGTQILLTTGDVRRIARFLGAFHFFTFEVPDPIYTDPGDDPVWLTLTIRPDGRRRVLKRTADKRCTMLAENGCLLPITVRPLICRLHPYSFTEAEVSGVDPTCPMSREGNWPVLLEKLGMAMFEARQWHRLLYCELREEKPAGGGDDGPGAMPVLEELPDCGERKAEVLNMPHNPCLTCGACCAFYRASFYWTEAADATPGGVPAQMTEKLNDFRLAMKGTGGSNPRCIALNGSIGQAVACSIYERRASVCREFEPSWRNNAANPRCDRARAAWGLAALKPESWVDPRNFPKAA